MTFMLITTLVIMNIFFWSWYLNLIERSKQLDVPYRFFSISTGSIGSFFSALSVIELIRLLN